MTTITQHDMSRLRVYLDKLFCDWADENHLYVCVCECVCVSITKLMFIHVHVLQ